MKIILCSTRDSVRHRLQAMLLTHNFSIYQASSMPMLRELLTKIDDYLLLVHQPFIDPGSIGKLCAGIRPRKVFILSDQPSEDEGMFMLKLGVAGYANAYVSEGRLMEAINTVVSGKVWFGHDVISRLIRSMSSGKEEPRDLSQAKVLESLTQRELEIAGLVAEGLSNKEIGNKLYISERTVKSHLGTIFQKTGTHSRVQLALLMQRQTKGRSTA